MNENERFPVIFNYGEEVDGGKLMEDLKFLLNRKIEVTRSIVIPSFGSDESVTIGDGTVGITVPSDINGWRLIKVLSSIETPSSSGTIDIQIRRARKGVDTDLLTTKVTISANDYFAEDGIIDNDERIVKTGDIIFADIDLAGSGALGLFTVLTFKE